MRFPGGVREAWAALSGGGRGLQPRPPVRKPEASGQSTRAETSELKLWTPHSNLTHRDLLRRAPGSADSVIIVLLWGPFWVLVGSFWYPFVVLFDALLVIY